MNARGHFAGGAATIRRPRIRQNPSDISAICGLNRVTGRARRNAPNLRFHPEVDTMRQWLTLGLALGLGLAFADHASAQIKLGVAGPITGGSAAFGAQLKNGVEQAVEDINAAGGILGQQITLSVGDDRADPKEGVSVANKFVGDGVKFVVGHFNSGVTIPASDVYQENGMLVITPAATNPKVTERGMWNVFRTCGRDDQQGGIAGAIVAERFKGKRVAVVHDKTTYGQGLADEMRKAMNAKGLKEIFYEGVNKDDKDFSALITKLK